MASPAQQLSNLERLDRELESLERQTARLTGMTEMLGALRDRAAEQDRLAAKLAELDGARAAERGQGEAFRQNLTREVTELRQRLHGQVESVREMGALTGDLVGDLGAQVRDGLARQGERAEALAAQVTHGHDALAARHEAHERDLAALAARHDALANELRGRLSTLRTLAIAGLVALGLALVLAAVAWWKARL